MRLPICSLLLLALAGFGPADCGGGASPSDTFPPDRSDAAVGPSLVPDAAVVEPEICPPLEPPPSPSLVAPLPLGYSGFASLVANAPAGASEVMVDSTVGFLAGDEVVVHQSQSDSISLAGQFEYAVVAATTDSSIRFQSRLRSAFELGGGSVAQVVRVQEFDALTLDAGQLLSAPAWNGHKGGLLALNVLGTLTFQEGSRIDMSGKGFRGGASHCGVESNVGEQGESFAGPPSQSCSANFGGGGGGDGVMVGEDDQLVPPEGYVKRAAGGGGGAGASGDDAYSGGRGVGYSCNGNGGAAGVASSPPAYTRLLFGSGGGAGGSNQGWNAMCGGDGGAGGGIVWLAAGAIAGDGVVSVEGAKGEDGGAGGGGGGGGGMIVLTRANDLDVGWYGGTGGNAGLGQSGGHGGYGDVWRSNPAQKQPLTIAQPIPKALPEGNYQWVVSKLNPAGERVAMWKPPGGGETSLENVVAGQDGRIWVSGTLAGEDAVVELDDRANELASVSVCLSRRQLAAGPHGLFVSSCDDDLTRLGYDGRIQDQVPLDPYDFASGLAVDRFGNGWATENLHGELRKINPAGETTGTFKTSSYPGSVTIASDGSIWTAGYVGDLDRFDSCGRRIGVFEGIYGDGNLAADQYGNVWLATEGSLAKVSPHGLWLVSVEFPNADCCLETQIAVGGQGNVWVALDNGEGKEAQIMELDPSGMLLGSFAAGASPRSIVVDADGNVWVVHKELISG